MTASIRLPGNSSSSPSDNFWPIRITSWMKQHYVDHYSNMDSIETARLLKQALAGWFSTVEGASSLSREERLFRAKDNHSQRIIVFGVLLGCRLFDSAYARQPSLILEAIHRVLASYWGPHYVGPPAPPSVDHFCNGFIRHADHLADFILFQDIVNNHSSPSPSRGKRHHGVASPAAIHGKFLLPTPSPSPPPYNSVVQTQGILDPRLNSYSKREFPFPPPDPVPVNFNFAYPATPGWGNVDLGSGLGLDNPVFTPQPVVTPLLDPVFYPLPGGSVDTNGPGAGIGLRTPPPPPPPPLLPSQPPPESGDALFIPPDPLAVISGFVPHVQYGNGVGPPGREGEGGAGANGGGGDGGGGNGADDNPFTPPRLQWTPHFVPPSYPIPYDQPFPQCPTIPNTPMTLNPDPRLPPGPIWEPGTFPPLPLGSPVPIRVHQHLLYNPVELKLPVLQWDITQLPECARVLTGKALVMKPYLKEPAVVSGPAAIEEKIDKIWIDSDNPTLLWWMRHHWGPLVIHKKPGKELTVLDVLEGIYQFLAKPPMHWDYEQIANMPTYPGMDPQYNLERLHHANQKRQGDLGSLDIPGCLWKGQWKMDSKPLPAGVPNARMVPFLSYDFRRSDVLGSQRKFVGLRPMVLDDGTWVLLLGLHSGPMVKV